VAFFDGYILSEFIFVAEPRESPTFRPGKYEDDAGNTEADSGNTLSQKLCPSRRQVLLFCGLFIK